MIIMQVVYITFFKVPLKFAKIFRTSLPFKFSLKDAWLVLYSTNSLSNVLSKSTIEFLVAVILFEICSVGKTYRLTESSSKMSIFMQYYRFISSELIETK